ncbi:MAG: cytochrome c maturation protein CcmE [Chloroflexi bacterium]|nr:cytochrome c maturation protein CcmE [Chloroflexota bacterium]
MSEPGHHTAPEQEPQSYALPEPLNERSVLAHRGKLLIGLGVFLVALGYLGFTAFQSASAYYLTVGELIAKGDAVYGKNLRVNGKLMPSSFEREPNGTIIHFSLTDGVETVDATYNGLVPDLFFNENSQIMLEGTYGSNGVFDAQAIIVKCPSKYQAETPSP